VDDNLHIYPQIQANTQRLNTQKLPNPKVQPLMEQLHQKIMKKAFFNQPRHIQQFTDPKTIQQAQSQLLKIYIPNIHFKKKPQKI